MAVELGALGGTRTPNLLIRRSMESVRSVYGNPYPHVSVIVEYPAWTLQSRTVRSVREKVVRDSRPCHP
jgi:hypothetical protein